MNILAQKVTDIKYNVIIDCIHKLFPFKTDQGKIEVAPDLKGSCAQIQWKATKVICKFTN